MRVFFIVLDSFGIGGAKDAAAFGDEGANTLKSLTETENFNVPNLTKLGLFNIDGMDYKREVAAPIGSYARMREKSQGKDTTIGHFELAGVVSKKPLPTYPNGFPPEIIKELENAFGRKIICNKPYSGTEVIKDYGREHEKTGALIVYTSADSVLQIAAHESIVPIDTLYKYCRQARGIMTGEHAVGRIIARPFIGADGKYERTPRRHDFSVKPPKKTVLDELKDAGYATIGVGKTFDIFAGVGISENLGVNENNADGMRKTESLINRDFSGIVFTNLVDFDMVYGHRRDPIGYANAIMEFDAWLSDFLPKLKDTDTLMITADHGCDPRFKGTDHTREDVPLMIYNGKTAAENLGTKDSFTFAADYVRKLFF